MKTISDPYLKTSDLGKWPAVALIAGIGGAVACAAIALLKPELFYRSYLVGYMFWVNVGLGSLLLLMIQHLSGGHWGIVIRRVLESSSRTIIWMLILFIPILLGMGELYEWTHQDVVNKDEVLQQKAPYLNTPMFLMRLGMYFGLWWLLTYFLTSWSRQQDKTADPRLPSKMRNLSGPGVVLFFISMTFASVDWVLSLEPHYYSTMFGPVIMVGQGLAAMAFTVAILVVLSRIPPMSHVMTQGHFHDLGKFMLMFTMLWAYINFSQFLITWAANLTEEIPYYLKRMSGGWGVIAIGLIVFHFFFPFLLLLNRALKRNPNTIFWVAIWLIGIRFVDLIFLILPSASHGYVGHFDIMAVLFALVSVIAVGGLWFTLFLRFLVQRPMIPLNDPYLQEALEFRGGH